MQEKYVKYLFINFCISSENQRKFVVKQFVQTWILYSEEVVRLCAYITCETRADKWHSPVLSLVTHKVIT